jgi:hypothetical protein
MILYIVSLAQLFICLVFNATMNVLFLKVGRDMFAMKPKGKEKGKGKEKISLF